ncbi:ribonucleotide reductase of class III (anaerobic), large subunit [Vibrio phage JSF12]|uniref:Ribonucleotide reductase of class III (Anaerobic), large subunit n=2 Tax=Jesfedecavirus TaxID=2560156 RepID=A0A2D0Z2Y0_9CAUD|nr:ribonucleotide reductase of class III (anaerobic), large subunit [Vibrio phage JSF10]YP_009794684.1 ribonucleotide reductase of class III (anaerobic), large subunit [Vibrio phage JSF12]ASV43427.1 ribonucleotide reductase of class III (anaerobic), large subunit [Vibrio phage JSF10]ASV43519.1 ribonucleotide reductase of class III (anaerobic), large subunit [Vibrio phage JSF12]
MLVIKKDNTRQALIPDKIFEAVFMAASDADFEYNEANQVAEDVTTLVVNKLLSSNKSSVTIFEIEELIEDTLMSSCWKQVARKFIEYSHDRQQARDLRSSLHQNIIGLVDQTNPDLLHENANKESALFHVQRDLLAGEISRHYALNYLLPRETAREHIAGNIHFHDLDYSPMMGLTNCCLVDLKGMLERGFKMGNARIEPPKSIQTAATVVSQVAAAVASQQFGGTSFDRLDEILAPYVARTFKKEYKRAMDMYRRFTGTDVVVDPLALSVIESEAKIATKKAVMDACQTLEYQVNTIYCTNGQTPFLTFGFGLGETWEAKLIQEGILRTRIQGLGEDKITPVFPKLVFTLKKGLNLDKEDPNYDIKVLALECASKRMYPKNYWGF